MAIDDWVSKGPSIGDSNYTEAPELRDYHPLPDGHYIVETTNQGGIIKMSGQAPWDPAAVALMQSMDFNLETDGGQEYLLAKGAGQRLHRYEVEKWQMTQEMEFGDVVVFKDRVTWTDTATGLPVETLWRWAGKKNGS